jgi:hypothetical protein
MKKILFGLVLALQLIAPQAFAQTYKVQNLQVLGTALLSGVTTLNASTLVSYTNATLAVNDTSGSGIGKVAFQSNGTLVWDILKGSGSAGVFAIERYVSGTYVDNPISISNSTGATVFTQRPTFAGNTPYDSGNFTPANYATLAGNQTFTGNQTLSGTNSIAGYLSTATAASTYLPITNPTATGTMTAGTFAGAATSLTGTAASLNVGGNAATATKATSLSGGSAANQIAYQSAPGTTSYISAPTTASTALTWNGSAFTWAAGGGGGSGSGTVTSVGLSGGLTGLTFSGGPVTTSGTFTAAGTLGAGYGGTGNASPTAHGVMLGQGTAAMTVAAAGAAGTTLVSQGTTADPKFASLGALVLSGADPTGVADSTTALQAFLTTVVTGGLEGDIPPGNYKISAALNVPFGYGWKIKGFSMGGTTITQSTSNTPIWNFATGANGGSPGDTGPYEWAINDMTLAWSSAQSTANTKSVGFFFTNSNETYFDWQVSRVAFVNAYRGLALDTTAATTVWGCSIRDIVYGSSNSGSAINFEAAGTGQPNISIDGVYITATNIASTEDLIGVNNNDAGWFNHIEINGNVNGSPILYLSGTGTIGSVKCEVCTFTSGQYVTRFPNAHFNIGSISFDNLTIAASGGAAYGIDANAGGGTTTLTIGQTDMSFASISGTFYLVNGGAAPAYSVRFTSAPQGLLGTANAFLTQVPASVSADGVSIDDWQQPRLTGDTGNASTTWAVGNPNIVQYNTTLTAARTVQLTDGYGNTGDTNLYNGAGVCVIRNATTPGNFALNITNGSGTNIGSLTNTNGRICYMWKRSIGAWSLTDYSTWAGTAP